MHNFLLPNFYPKRHYALVQDAIEEVIRKVQAPDALVAMEAGSCMGIVVQSLADIRSPTGQVRPLTINWAVIADSGERKTAVRTRFSEPIRNFDAKMAEAYKVDMDQYRADYSFWKATEAGIRQKITKLTREGKLVDDERATLLEHIKAKPVKPRWRCIMRQLSSRRALMDSVEGTGESVGFTSDEGDVLVKGGVFSQVGVINTLSDGGDLIMDRSEDVHLVAKEPRFSISFMIQRDMLKEFLVKRGNELRGSGHWARYLVGDPPTTQGTRFITDLHFEYEHLPKMHARMQELLEEHAKRLALGITKRDILELSEDAKRRWMHHANEIEVMLQPDQYLHDIKDFASKVLDITTRLAGVMHVFSAQKGEVSVDTFDRAVDIVSWHVHEFKKMFSMEFAVPAAHVDAEKVEDYLFRKVWQNNVTFLKKNIVLNYGPVRTKKQFEAALDCLIATNRVWIGVGDKRERYINLNPYYFGSKPVPLLHGLG